MSFAFSLLNLISKNNIFIEIDPCELCGSHQRFSESGDCFGCAVEKVTGLPFKINCQIQWCNQTCGNGPRFIALEHCHHDKKLAARSRAKAVKLGQRHYYGDLCSECGCNLYKSENAACEGCNSFELIWGSHRGNQKVFVKERSSLLISGKMIPVLTHKSDRKMREVAKMLGAHRYRGLPCECGDNWRYTNRGQCVPAHVKSARTTLAVPADFDFLFD